LKEITDRIGVHKVGLAFLQEFGWIEREQPISDYGIDMHIEIVENGIPTGQLIAVQIKSGESYFNKIREGKIIYRGKKRHLDYWQFHSIPVLIVLYHPKDDKIYWEKILVKNTIDTGKGWKIGIPMTNVLSVESKTEIEKYYYNRNHFITFKISDNSFGIARRVSAKIIVENKGTSKSSMERMIPFLVEEMKESDYFSNERNRMFFEGKQADVVLLFFYNNIQQATRGLPFCRASWSNEDCESKLDIPNPDNTINDIRIKWDSLHELFKESFIEKEMGKGTYLDLANETHRSSKEIYNSIRSNLDTYLIDLDFSRLKDEILKFGNKIDLMDNRINFKDYFTPLECIELDKLITIVIIYLSNILLVIRDKTRSEENMVVMIKSALEDCKGNLKYIEYEFRKIR
jgi:hypothetical protein